MIVDGDLEIYDAEECPQGSDVWKALRRGWPSASRLASVMAGGEGLTRSKYMRQLAGEQVTGLDREEDFVGSAMERGWAMEPELRDLYAFLSNEKPEVIGFARRKLKVGYVGASPDALVGARKTVEFKSAKPEVLIEILRRGAVPPEHMPQCQGTMLVLGRAACDLMVGYTGMPALLRTIPRDPSFIARLHVHIETFNEELVEMVRWIREYRS